MRSFLFAALAVIVTGQAVQADQWDALRADDGLQEALVQYSMGRRIYKRCDEISARRLRVLSYINGLIDRAEALGYSRSEVNAYISDEAEQDRITAIADARLAERGASPEEWDGYCTVGREEIAVGSTIGRLLR